MKYDTGLVKNIVWITQLGLSVAVPAGIFVFIGIFLKNHYQLGSWAIIVCSIIGLLISVSSFINTLKMINKNNTKKDENKTIGFNNHD